MAGSKRRSRNREKVCKRGRRDSPLQVGRQRGDLLQDLGFLAAGAHVDAGDQSGQRSFDLIEFGADVARFGKREHRHHAVLLDLDHALDGTAELIARCRAVDQQETSESAFIEAEIRKQGGVFIGDRSTHQVGPVEHLLGAIRVQGVATANDRDPQGGNDLTRVGGQQLVQDLIAGCASKGIGLVALQIVDREIVEFTVPLPLHPQRAVFDQDVSAQVIGQGHPMPATPVDEGRRIAGGKPLRMQHRGVADVLGRRHGGTRPGVDLIV
jgi:hypothetical protein